jgi:hypothetical protein
MTFSKQNNRIGSEPELREAFSRLWSHDPVVSWTWKESGTRPDSRFDAVADAVVDGHKTRFFVEFKLTPTARDVQRLSEERLPGPAVLIAPRLSESLVSLCRERNLSCADLNGRLWLRVPGLLIDRQPSAKARFRPALAIPDPFSLKSSRLVRTLLSHRDRRWSHTELVERTGLSKGLVSRLTRHLLDEGFLRLDDRRLFVERWDALLDAWA